MSESVPASKGVVVGKKRLECEANAVMRGSARPATIRLLRGAIEDYLGAEF